MKKNGKKFLLLGALLIIVFGVWTALIQTIDVKPVLIEGTTVGFSTFNLWFHKMTGVNMAIYNITDWLGLVPLFVCLVFGMVGFIQLIKRRSLFKVDLDIILLGIYYVIVILCYFIFEMIPINYRPILIEGILEASYPSSTTLLVLSVMPTLAFQVNRRLENITLKRIINIFVVCFSAFMVIGRLTCGVHWFTDIIGAAFLSTGLFFIYKGFVLQIFMRK